MTIVYKIHVVRVVDGLNAALAKSSAAHKLYNDSIAIIRAGRDEYRAIRARYVPGLDEAEDRLAEVKDKIESLRQTIRDERKRASVVSKSPRVVVPTKRVDDDATMAEIAALKAERKQLSAALKNLRARFAALTKPADDEHRRRAKEICGDGGPHAKARANAETSEQMLGEPQWSDAWKECHRAQLRQREKLNAARRDSTCGVGAYLAVDQALQAAQKAPQPSYARWKGGRKVGVQLRNTTWGMACGGASTALRVDNRVKSTAKGLRGQREWARVQLRIDTDDARDPVIVTLDVMMHRPIAPDTVISWAYLVPEQTPRGTAWSLQLTADTVIERRSTGTGSAVVSLRWSLMGAAGDASRKLAFAVVDDDTGRRRVLSLPADVIEAREHARRIRSASDVHFDVARDALTERLRLGLDMPDAARARCEPLHADDDGRCVRGPVHTWRNHARLATVAREWIAAVMTADELRSLWHAWRVERLQDRKDLFCPPDELRAWLALRGSTDSGVAFGVWLEWWRRKDQHLDEYASNVTRHAIRARNALYTETAIGLAKRYASVEIRNGDLAQMAKRKATGEDLDELHRAARRQRFDAGLYDFKQALQRYFGERYTEGAASGDEAAEMPAPLEAV